MSRPSLEPEPQPADGVCRAVIYARVATTEGQASGFLADQVDQCRRYAAQNGITVVDQYVEGVWSGTDEHRPKLQQMIGDAKALPRPFEVILVHSFSRFARDSLIVELAIRKLRKLGVRLVSITQDGDLSHRNTHFTDQQVSKVLAALSVHLSAQRHGPMADITNIEEATDE